jgi:predicted DNA-binding transcriptional regulator YafY
MTPSGRLLRLLSLLQRRPYWSGPELADELGVSARTIRRDVERLREHGYHVEASPSAAGGYRLGGGGAAIPPLLLDDAEAAAVALALGVTAGGPASAVRDLAEPSLAALAKLDRLLPPELRARVDAIRSATTLLARPTSPDAVDADVLVGLAQACDGHERVTLTYRDREQRETERRVEPYRLVATGRRWYLLAHDLERRDWRTFRVDRIVDPRNTGHRFVPVDDPPDAESLVARSITTAPYRYQAVVDFDCPPAELARRIPPTVGVVRPDRRPGTTTRATLTVGSDDLPALAGRLFALDLPFEVRSPPELRSLLRRQGRRIASRHRHVPPLG